MVGGIAGLLLLFGGGTCTKSKDIRPFFFTMHCYAVECRVCVWRGVRSKQLHYLICFVLFCFFVFGLVWFHVHILNMVVRMIICAKTCL